MWKNLLYSLFIMIFSTSLSYASDKVHVRALEHFSTENPSETIDVSLVNDSTIGNYSLNAGDVLHCKVQKIKDPKRGKRSAGFTVCPLSYTSNDKAVQINDEYYGKYAAKVISKEELKNIDKKKVGKKAVVTVGNHFVKGLAPAISLTQGMIKNEEGNVVKSGVKQVYKDSPLSYVEKGKSVVLEPGDTFYLLFKSQKQILTDTNDDSDEESMNEANE